MYRTELADQIKIIIDNSPPEKWGGVLKLGTASPATTNDNYVSVDVALDPFVNGGVYKPGVFIIPGYKQFLEPTQRGSRGNVGTQSVYYVTFALCVQLTGQSSEGAEYDQFPRSEWQKWMDLKDDLDKFLFEFDYSTLKLRINEPPDVEPPDEISLNQRYYLETTVIGYVKC